MSTSNLFPLEITDRQNKQADLNFYSETELKEWVKNELVAWEWLKSAGGGSSVQNLWNRTFALHNGIISALERLETATPPQALQLIEQIKSNLNSLSKEGIKFDSKDARAIGIISHSTSPVFAQNLLLLHLGRFTDQKARAAVHFELEKRGCDATWIKNAEAQFNALTDRASARTSQFTDEVEAQKSLISSQNAEFTELCDRSQKINDDNRVYTLKLLDEFKTKQLAIATTAEADFNRVKSLYEEFMQLRGPVTYWTKKADTHFWHSFWIVIAYSVGLFFLVLIVFGEVTMFVLPLLEPTKEGEIRDVAIANAIPRLGIVLLTVTLGVWPLRLLTKTLLSQLHLASDSRHRATVLTTYLAMLEANKLDDKERKVILETLFRPASTGVVKDDGAPPSALELLKMLTTNGK